MRNMLLRNIRFWFKNLKAIINRQLTEFGFGGGIVNGWTELNVVQIRDGKVIKKRRVLDKVVLFRSFRRLLLSQ
jgi:hypothetical protein